MPSRDEARAAFAAGQTAKAEGMPTTGCPFTGDRTNSTPYNDPQRGTAYLRDCWFSGYTGEENLPALSKGDPALS